MNVSGVNHSLFVRFTNYCQEKTNIQQKLQNPQVPQDKKNRLQIRLNDLEERLIPETTRKLN